MRRTFWSLGLPLVAALGTASIAAAQDNSSKAKPAHEVIPMPPLRPATLLPPAPPAPATLQPVFPAPAVPAGKDPMVYDFSPDMPQELPPASRAQMHKCGEEWQKMKSTGAAAEKTWLAFARGCLVQQTNP